VFGLFQCPRFRRLPLRPAARTYFARYKERPNIAPLFKKISSTSVVKVRDVVGRTGHGHWAPARSQCPNPTRSTTIRPYLRASPTRRDPAPQAAQRGIGAKVKLACEASALPLSYAPSSRIVERFLAPAPLGSDPSEADALEAVGLSE